MVFGELLASQFYSKRFDSRFNQANEIEWELNIQKLTEEVG